MDAFDALIDPARAEDEIRALRQQRRLLGDLIDDLSVARRGLQQRLSTEARGEFGTAAGAWRSPSSNAYDRRVDEMTRRLGDVVDQLQAALGAVHGAIARRTTGV